MKSINRVVRIGQILMFLNALLWIVTGVLYLTRYFTSDRVPFWVVLVISGGMLIYGGILVLLGFLLRLRRKTYYYSAVILMALSVILPFFDQVGLADLIALVPAICALIFLIFKKGILSGQVTGK